MDSIFHEASFGNNSKFGHTRRAMMEQSEIARFVMLRSPRTYSALKESLEAFSSARETFSMGDNAKVYLPKKIIQRPNAWKRKIEDKVDTFANQLSELSLLVKNILYTRLF